jgi:hypothetical protein
MPALDGTHQRERDGSLVEIGVEEVALPGLDGLVARGAPGPAVGKVEDNVDVWQIAYVPDPEQEVPDRRHATVEQAANAGVLDAPQPLCPPSQPQHCRHIREQPAEGPEHGLGASHVAR